MKASSEHGVTAGPGPAQRLWVLASSPVTFVVLSILWCLDLAVGSIYAYRLDPQFWVKMDAYPFNVWLQQVAPVVFPHSWWVYGLVVLTYLMVLSLAVCTLNWFFRRRHRARGMGEVLVHLGFLLVFAGFVLGSGFGVRVQGVRVPQGATVPLPDLGLALHLEGVDVVRGAGGRAVDTVSRVRLLEGEEEVAAGTLRTNHPLIAGTTVVYPQGAQSSITGAKLVLADGGAVTLQRTGQVLLGDTSSLRLDRILHPGERFDHFFGPGFLVSRRAADGRQMGQVFLSPVSRKVVDLAGVRLRLMDLEVAPVGLFNVHRDPGVPWVLAGAAILTAGTLWALWGYLRAHSPRPGGRGVDPDVMGTPLA